MHRLHLDNKNKKIHNQQIFKYVLLFLFHLNYLTNNMIKLIAF